MKRGLLLIGSTVVALLLVESAARAYLAFAAPRSLLQAWRPGTPAPLPYRGATYFGDEFVREYEAVDEGPSSFRGRYFTIVDGLRATTGAPPSAVHRVWLFGGSTMFSAEVPDSETIASHLQRLSNQRRSSLDVMNRGVVALTTQGAADRLVTLDITPGDVVVFYGGVNSVTRDVYSAESGHWILDRIGRALDRSRKFSAAARLVADVGTRTSPAAVRDGARLSRNVARMVAQYEASLLRASEYVRSRGGHFHHVLQPHLFSKDAWSPYERELLGRHLDVPVGLDTAFRAAYPPLREMLRGLAARGLSTFDLSDAFDGLPPGTEIYFDFCHVNHIANAIVARRIYDAIWTGETSGP